MRPYRQAQCDNSQELMKVTGLHWIRKTVDRIWGLPAFARMSLCQRGDRAGEHCANGRMTHGGWDPLRNSKSTPVFRLVIRLKDRLR